MQLGVQCTKDRTDTSLKCGIHKLHQANKEETT